MTLVGHLVKRFGDIIIIKEQKSGYQIIRGGAWALELKFSRSAMRFTHSNNDKGSHRNAS